MTGTTINSFPQAVHLGITWEFSSAHPPTQLTSLPSCSHPVTKLYLTATLPVHEEYPQLFRIKISLFGLAHKLSAPVVSRHSPASGLQSSYT